MRKAVQVRSKAVFQRALRHRRWANCAGTAGAQIVELASEWDQAIAALQAEREGYFAACMDAFMGTHPDPATLAWTLSIARQAALHAEVQCLRTFAETDLRPDLASVTVPCRIVHGTADVPMMPGNARRTQAGIAGSRLEIYEGAPHALFVTDRDRFNRELLEFARS